MFDVYTIYHNPRCAKSRLTLRLMRRKCESFYVVKYLDNPPSAEFLLTALEKLGRAAMVRRNEDAYRECVYKREKSIHDEELAQIMAENPSIIQRPLVVAPDGRMAMGRPPENIENIL